MLGAVIAAIGLLAAFFTPKKWIYGMGVVIIVFGILLVALNAMGIINNSLQLVVLADMALFLVIGLLLIVDNRRKFVAVLLGTDPVTGEPIGDMAQPEPYDGIDVDGVDKHPQQEPGQADMYGPQPISQPPSPYADTQAAPQAQQQYQPTTTSYEPKQDIPKMASIVCPKCSSKISIDPKARGSVITCPACGVSGRVN